MHTLTLFGSRECCLCDEAKAVLDRVGLDIPFELEMVDIYGVPLLTERYGTKIPVLCIDGNEVFVYRIHEKKLRQLLAKP